MGVASVNTSERRKAVAVGTASQRKAKPGNSLLERKQEAAKQQPKRPLSKAERQARNKRLTEQYLEERLRASFGPEREAPKRRSKGVAGLIPDEDWEDDREVD